MIRVLRVLCLLAVASSTAFAQTRRGGDPIDLPGGDADNGLHAATLLRMGIAPRAVALGEAMGAVEGDATSLWYNAAGIARIKTNSFLVTGAQRFGDTQLAGAVVTFPTTLGTFGVGARAFNAGTIEETDNYEPTGLRTRAYQLALEGGGAIQLASHWIWGGTLFYHQETLGSESQNSIGINSGMLFPDIFSRLTLGAGIRNWGTEETFEEEGFRPPFMGYVAGGFDLLKQRNLLQTPMLFRGQPVVVDAKIVGQAEQWRRSEISGAAGIEGTVNGVVIGRIGYRLGDDNDRGLSLGAGINVGQFRLEYAFRNRKNTGASLFEFDPIGDEHHVSASYYWGGAQTNAPAVPVIVTQPVDTAAINAIVQGAIERNLALLRPLLDSLRSAQVEVRGEGTLTAEYIVPVHFAFDSAVVSDSDMVVLGQVADVIRQIYPSALVTITGFADPAGTVPYNLALSQRRSEAVRDVMVGRFGLPAQQFKTVGYGEQPVRQVVPGAKKDEPGAVLNRRVSFTIDATQRF
jgi:outer membrane protein OmpA-like peptidoglycan-associated protein